VPHEHHLIALPTHGLGDEAVQARLEKSWESIRKLNASHVAVLLHASVCGGKHDAPSECGAALLSACRKMKAFLKHHLECRAEKKERCDDCRRIAAVLALHVKACKAQGARCPVPRCAEMKEIRRLAAFSGSGMDARRRAKANEIATGGAAAGASADAAGGSASAGGAPGGKKGDKGAALAAAGGAGGAGGAAPSTPVSGGGMSVVSLTASNASSVGGPTGVTRDNVFAAKGARVDGAPPSAGSASGGAGGGGGGGGGGGPVGGAVLLSAEQAQVILNKAARVLELEQPFLAGEHAAT
jgi:hypothetical protein